MSDLHDMLWNESHWEAHDGRVLRINPDVAGDGPVMGRFHAAALCKWLDRRAPNFHFAYGLMLALSGSPTMGDTAMDWLEIEVMEHESRDPHDWLHETPLYRAAARRARGVPGAALAARNRAYRMRSHA